MGVVTRTRRGDGAIFIPQGAPMLLGHGQFRRRPESEVSLGSGPPEADWNDEDNKRKLILPESGMTQGLTSVRLYV